MLVHASLVLLGALSVAAQNPHHIRSVFASRQLSASSIPSACTSTCSSALTIYNACLNGDTNTCLSVCQQDTYNGFVGCFSCIVDNTDGISSSEVTQLNGAISQLQSACAAAGESVTGGSISGGAAATGGSASAGVTGAATASGAGASFTSAASGGLTIGASGASALSSAAASASGAASSNAASLTNTATTAATTATGAGASSAAATTSKAAGAGPVAQLPSFVGAAVALVGVVGGAALLL